MWDFAGKGKGCHVLVDVQRMDELGKKHRIMEIWTGNLEDLGIIGHA